MPKLRLPGTCRASQPPAHGQPWRQPVWTLGAAARCAMMVGALEWALAQRTRYRELALQALHTLTTRCLEAADYAAAIDAATHLLALDAWREEGYRQLMLALARTGQLAAALAQYQRCHSVMQEIFGAEPAEETTALYTRIRAALVEQVDRVRALQAWILGRFYGAAPLVPQQPSDLATALLDHPNVTVEHEAKRFDHAKVFTVHAIIHGNVWGVGHGKSKQIASQEAAADALRFADAQQHQETISPPAAYQTITTFEPGDPSNDASAV